MIARRIVPTHFRSDGKPKRAYPNEQIARIEAARLGMTFYRCDFCDRYHLASGEPERRGGEPSRRSDTRRG